MNFCTNTKKKTTISLAFGPRYARGYHRLSGVLLHTLTSHSWLANDLVQEEGELAAASQDHASLASAACKACISVLSSKNKFVRNAEISLVPIRGWIGLIGLVRTSATLCRSSSTPDLLHSTIFRSINRT